MGRRGRLPRTKEEGWGEILGDEAGGGSIEAKIKTDSRGAIGSRRPRQDRDYIIRLPNRRFVTPRCRQSSLIEVDVRSYRRTAPPSRGQSFVDKHISKDTIDNLKPTTLYHGSSMSPQCILRS